MMCEAFEHEKLPTYRMNLISNIETTTRVVSTSKILHEIIDLIYLIFLFMNISETLCVICNQSCGDKVVKNADLPLCRQCLDA